MEPIVIVKPLGGRNEVLFEGRTLCFHITIPYEEDSVAAGEKVRRIAAGDKKRMALVIPKATEPREPLKFVVLINTDEERTLVITGRMMKICLDLTTEDIPNDQATIIWNHFLELVKDAP